MRCVAFRYDTSMHIRGCILTERNSTHEKRIRGERAGYSGTGTDGAADGMVKHYSDVTRLSAMDLKQFRLRRIATGRRLASQWVSVAQHTRGHGNRLENTKRRISWNGAVRKGIKQSYAQNSAVTLKRTRQHVISMAFGTRAKYQASLANGFAWIARYGSASLCMLGYGDAILKLKLPGGLTWFVTKIFFNPLQGRIGAMTPKHSEGMFCPKTTK